MSLFIGMSTQMESEAGSIIKLVRAGDYILKSKIGEGSYSTVWRAQHISSGEEVAIKEVYLARLNRRLKTSLDCEIDFLSSVNHPNIIRLVHVFQVHRSPLTFWFNLLITCFQI